MHFANASDYSGSHLQQTIVEALGHTLEELGSSNAPTVDYPGPARTIAAAIFTERAERAVPTGQSYKGGPNTGVFLQITCDDAEDLRFRGRNTRSES